VSKHSLIATLFVGLVSLSARAQDKPAPTPAPAPPGNTAPAAPSADTRPKWIVACEGDIKKHCAEAAKTGGDTRPCLADHENDLTQGCKDAFIRQYRIVQLCREDIEKLCGANAEPRAIAKCFNEKQDQLSPKCRSALSRGSRAHDKAEAKAEAKPEPAAEAPKKKKAAKTSKPE
jgi:hypothetical protein